MRVVPRIAISVLAPPIIGGTVATFFAAMMSGEWQGVSKIVAAVPFFVMMAFLYAGIQSVCYALILECGYILGLQRRTVLFLGLSTILGIVSVYPIIYLTTAPPFSSDVAWLWGVGALTGFAVGGLLYLSERGREAAEPGATDNPDDAQHLREDH